MKLTMMTKTTETMIVSQHNLYEVRYVNQCHLNANRQLAKKLSPVYVVADNFLDAVELAHQRKLEDFNVFSVTLEQQNVTILKL